MELSHQFTVPTGIEETWGHFDDIVGLAECFPGAKVTSAEGDSFAGSVKVKLGPIALVYNGSGTFVDKDAAAKRFVVEAKGTDKRGNGTAGAHVVVTMTETGASTDVSVATDLAITGKPAQFGRGVMQDVSDKLLGQFVACLEERLTGGGVPVDDVSDTAHHDADAANVPVGGPQASAADRVAPPRRPSRPEPEALDIGAAALPVLAKLYWKPVLGGLIVLEVLRRLLRR
ncbi:SRPBCC family protein [Nocardioides sp.]|uniref:SRPBCC family protein n=1 Tax=Nocardioides sp. TaxID=35761 RepID=UPI002C5A40BB|nr:SRPBCC family protein [Nocardioides sp.]HXH78927.1 SRPBCC family protein [Nocardioides sp.]